jgi:putative CocE/NonD family hydrolase
MKTGYKRKAVLLVAALLLLLLACGMAALVLSTRETVQRQSLYLEMRDGVKIAVDVWLPADLEPGQKLPAILRSTRYWRSYQPGPMAPIFRVLGPILGQDMDAEGKDWTGTGYALVTVDARGSGASFGQRPIEYSDDEIADLGEVVAWIVAQPWSNGRVGAYGVSYDGNTAELLTALHHPAVKAVAPQYDDFDTQFHLLTPGGVFNQGFIRNGAGLREGSTPTTCAPWKRQHRPTASSSNPSSRASGAWTTTRTARNWPPPWPSATTPT